MPSKDFEVMTRMAGGDDSNAENTFSDGTGKPQRFTCAEAALAEVKELLEDVQNAVARGDMSETYNPADYFIIDRRSGQKYEVTDLLAAEATT